MTRTTPRFPEGLTVLEAAGQWQEADGDIIEEFSKVVLLLYRQRPEESHAEIEATAPPTSSGSGRTVRAPTSRGCSAPRCMHLHQPTRTPEASARHIPSGAVAVDASSLSAFHATILDWPLAEDASGVGTMPDLPSGTVTFLFTDIESGTERNLTTE